MARTKNEDVEVVETEEVVDAEETTEKAPKAKKQPARGELPEGYVTPVGFAKIATERELHTARDGSHEVKPQMVYSYIKNAPKDDPFPIVEVEDSLGKTRQAVLPEEGIAWWERKNERVATKKANAAEKAAKKAARAAAKEAEASEAEGEADVEVTEAE